MAVQGMTWVLPVAELCHACCTHFNLPDVLNSIAGSINFIKCLISESRQDLISLASVYSFVK